MALKTALKIEEAVAEKYLHKLMVMKTDSRAVSYIQQFYTETKSHAEMIKDFLK